VEAPNIIRKNTLSENLADVEEKDRFDIILANPPFGGKERSEVLHNFPIATSETAYLFLQHFIKYLRAGGRAGIVIKNTFLSNTDNASIELRRYLLESCNLYAVLDLPGGVFTGAGVKTVVLFFEKGLAKFIGLQSGYPDVRKNIEGAQRFKAGQPGVTAGLDNKTAAAVIFLTHRHNMPAAVDQRFFRRILSGCR